MDGYPCSLIKGAGIFFVYMLQRRTSRDHFYKSLMIEPKKTIFYEKHTSYGAKIEPFAGFLMPISYSGIISEHQTTRKKATIFDTCHMGEFLLKGNGVISDLERLLSCNVATLKQGQCRYGFICNEKGCVIDDQILYRLGDEEFMMVVNASRIDIDLKWITTNISSSTEIKNISSETAKIDLQGPESPKILKKVMNEFPLDGLKYYHFNHFNYKGEKIIISRTGYTGEIGFEFYSSLELALILWEEFIKEGATPAGLGARDTLRLEMGYPLYGHELTEDINASWSGFKGAIAEKDFIGSGKIKEAFNSRDRYFLKGILIEGRRSSREGDIVIDKDGNRVGWITSGSYSPSLGNAIALAYLFSGWEEKGKEVDIMLKERNIILKGIVTDTPFYKNGTVRDDLTKYK